jgi:hypothetical protein
MGSVASALRPALITMAMKSPMPTRSLIRFSTRSRPVSSRITFMPSSRRESSAPTKPFSAFSRWLKGRAAQPTCAARAAFTAATTSSRVEYLTSGSGFRSAGHRLPGLLLGRSLMARTYRKAPRKL